jgi:hypothetical protein
MHRPSRAGFKEKTGVEEKAAGKSYDQGEVFGGEGLWSVAKEAFVPRSAFGG